MENNKTTKSIDRVIGLDSHPDSFTAAFLRGPTPATAVVEKTFDKVPMSRLVSWARKNTTEQDEIVLEASGNSFEVVRRLRKINRRAHVLESCQLGKLKEAHANNDRISAVRIGKAYLAGTAKKVWVLATEPVEAQKQLRAAMNWSDRQWQVIQIMLLDLHHAEEQRTKWRSLIAQEVASDPLLLSLMRLCGVRVLIAFSLGAIIGDINRFASPKALVKYAGLNPAFDNSGENNWSGGIGGHGRKDLRSLLIEAAHSILRSKHPLAKWGKKLLARKGLMNLVVAAIARKLTVAIWYLMMGRWTPVQEVDSQLKAKISKLISTITPSVLKSRSLTRKSFRDQLALLLQDGRTYQLKPHP